MNTNNTVIFKNYDEELTAAIQASLQAQQVTQPKKSCLKKSSIPSSPSSSPSNSVETIDTVCKETFKKAKPSCDEAASCDEEASKVRFHTHATRFDCNSIEVIKKLDPTQPQQRPKTKLTRNVKHQMKSGGVRKIEYSFLMLMKDYVAENNVLMEEYLHKAFVQCVQDEYDENNLLFEKEELGVCFVKALYEIVEAMEKGDVTSPRDNLQQLCLEKMAITPPEDPDEEKITSLRSVKINLKEAYEDLVKRVFKNSLVIIVLDKFFEQQRIQK